MSVSSPAFVAALDGLRCRWLRVVSRTPGFASWFPDARRRLAIAGLATFTWATIAACLAPVTFLIGSTLLLGPLHLLAHMRYLPALASGGGAGAERGSPLYAAAFLACSVATCVTLTSFPAMALIGVPPQVLLFRAAALGLAGVTILRFARGGGIPAAIPGLAFALLTWICAGSTLGLLALTFLHNLLAFVHWIGAARASGMARFARLAMCVSLVGFLGLALLPWERFPAYGIVDALIWTNEAWNEAFVRQTANVPLELVERAPRLLTVFAVTQALHYFVWLRGIPDSQAERGVPRPFRTTWRMLRSRVGMPGLVAWSIASAGFLAWAFRDPTSAKEAYLAFALVHALVEIAAVRVTAAGAS